MGLNQESVISAYENMIADKSDSVIEEELKRAQDYNDSLYGNVIITDPFDPDFMPRTDLKYESLINLNGDGIMGYIDVPKADINLPIYHGTSEEVLEKGAGHLRNTSLPIGGVGTHSVLTGHTALSSARLFTDLTQLEKGDVMYVHVLGKILAYEVDQIKVVEPNETDELKINPEEDYVTLVTCTPYGINTHRLLVRGTRIPYVAAEAEAQHNEAAPVESTWMLEYKKALTSGAVLLCVIFILFIIIRILWRRKKKRSKIKATVTDSDENDELTVEK